MAPSDDPEAAGSSSGSLSSYRSPREPSTSLEPHPPSLDPHPPSLVLQVDSGYTLRAPVQEVATGAAAAGGDHKVLVVDGHTHQLLLTASLSRRAVSASARSSGQVEPSGSKESGAGEWKDEAHSVHLQLSVRKAQKFRLAGVFAMRFVMSYGAAIAVAYLTIFGINTLIKYVMSVFITAISIYGYTAWGIVTICGVPILCIFLSSVASISLGMLLDIWHDYEWIDACMELGRPVLWQWIPFATNLMVPFLTYAVWSFVDPAEAYTYALLASLICLLVLYSVYFATVSLSQIRICYTLVDDGKGFWDTMVCLLWVVTAEAFGSRVCLPRQRHTDSGSRAPAHQANPLRSEEAPPTCRAHTHPLCFTEGEEPASQISTVSQQLPSFRGCFDCCPDCGDDLEYDQHTMRGTPQPSRSCCGGLLTTQERWTPHSLNKENYGYSVTDRAPLTSSCCFIPGTKSSGPQTLSSLNGFLAFMLLCAVLMLAIVGTTTEALDETDAADVLGSLALAVLLILCCCWPTINRLRPRRHEAGCGFTGPGSGLRRERIPVCVPHRVVRVTMAGCVVLVFSVAPIVAFTGLAGRTGQWYLNGIVYVSVLYSLFASFFNITEVLRWAGPAGTHKLQSRSWKLARQAYLIRTRMHLRAARFGFLTVLGFLAVVLLAVSIGGITQGSSNYAGVDFDYSATFQPDGRGQQYPICTLKQPIANLSVVDYAFLSDIAYIHNLTQAKLRVDQYFGEGYLQTTLQEFKSFSGDTFGSYYTLRVAGTNKFVIAIRGTSTMFDLIADANLWVEVALIQIVRFLMPAGTAWDPAYPYIIKMLNVDQGNDAFNYYTDIHSTVERLLTIPNATVVLTGHSLGGGLGMIVSALSSVPAILFSGPNAMLSRMKFNVTAAQLDEWPINVIPGSDPVSHVDLPGSLAQRISCKAYGTACHHLDRTQCELQQACGSYGRPAIAPAQCAKYGYNYTLPAVVK